MMLVSCYSRVAVILQTTNLARTLAGQYAARNDARRIRALLFVKVNCGGRRCAFMEMTLNATSQE